MTRPLRLELSFHRNYECLKIMATAALGATEINTFLRACENGDLKYVKECTIEKSIDNVDIISDENGNTGLQVASANDQLEVLKFLIRNHAKINLGNDCGWTSLHHASLYGHNEIIKELMKNGASFTMRNKLGATPLHIAVASGHVSTFKYAIIKLINLIDSGPMRKKLQSCVRNFI